MENRIVSLVIDATEAELLAQFWAEVLGWQVVDRGNYGVSTGVDGGPFEIDFRFVPDGPKLAKNRLHLDLKPVNRDQAAELSRLVALGARQADVGQGDLNWVVLADPQGIEFRLCRPDAYAGPSVTVAQQGTSVNAADAGVARLSRCARP